MEDVYLKCPFAEAKPVGEVKQGIGVVFEGEAGVSPHTRAFPRVTGHHLRALQQLGQVNLTRNSTILALRTTTNRVKKGTEAKKGPLTSTL